MNLPARTTNAPPYDPDWGRPACRCPRRSAVDELVCDCPCVACRDPTTPPSHFVVAWDLADA
jgi:hypothetical protein